LRLRQFLQRISGYTGLNRAKSVARRKPRALFLFLAGTSAH
jgi:hypothetical protein